MDVFGSSHSATEERATVDSRLQGFVDPSNFPYGEGSGICLLYGKAVWRVCAQVDEPVCRDGILRRLLEEYGSGQEETRDGFPVVRSASGRS